MRPLADWTVADRARVAVLLTDIDDTLSTHGRLTAQAYAAVETLSAAGVQVVPITGRPAGWCDHIARFWPVAGVVGENGALWMRYDLSSRKLIKRFLHSDEERRAARDRFASIAQRIMAAVPGCAIASDQLYRESDLAIDWCEDVVPLARREVDRIVALMHDEGMTAKVSSIHVNGWFGDYDKLGMTRRFVAEALRMDLDHDSDRFAFVGDSPNDAPMFAFFANSVGVANVRRFEDALEAKPRYVTRAESGAGFAEVAHALLAARG
ncbi:MAG TPA: HAD-IIB family hydrolase [Casimicrobiaceae bacterium]|nr:HAD-IIB family hydrolase [Casimicrobiaceae bacterium]